MVEGPASNWIILEDNGAYALIDGGYPGAVPRVLDSIRGLGLSAKDAAAMLITHGHVDHTGAAAYFASELCVPVLSSHAEHTQMTGEERFQFSPVQILLRAWQPRVFKWMRHVLTVGVTKGTKVLEANLDHPATCRTARCTGGRAYTRSYSWPQRIPPAGCKGTYLRRCTDLRPRAQYHHRGADAAPYVPPRAAAGLSSPCGFRWPRRRLDPARPWQGAALPTG